MNKRTRRGFRSSPAALLSSGSDGREWSANRAGRHEGRNGTASTLGQKLRDTKLRLP